MFRSPQFWNTINPLSILLYPVSVLYSWISKARYSLQKPYRCKAKVICIGNVTVGGSGKTPLAAAIGKLLLSKHHKIAYACKNYGASIKSATKVLKIHSPKEVIDEALLLSKIAPTFIASSRLEAVKAASEVADIVIADDGLQNNSFYKDLSILAVPEDTIFGNNLIFPAGPLRESLEDGLKKADLVFMMHSPQSSSSRSGDPGKKQFPPQVDTYSYFTQALKIKGTPFGENYLIPGSPLREDDDWGRIFQTCYEYKLCGPKRKCYIAFCSIANPTNFFASLENLKVKLSGKLIYSDHYIYTEKDLSTIIAKAKAANVGLITTEKDLVKLDKKYLSQISYLKLTVQILDKDKLCNFVTDLSKAIN